MVAAKRREGGRLPDWKLARASLRPSTRGPVTHILCRCQKMSLIADGCYDDPGERRESTLSCRLDIAMIGKKVKVLAELESKLANSLDQLEIC